MRLIPSTTGTHENDMICIGGPSVNLVTREFLQNRKLYTDVELIYPNNIIRDKLKNIDYRAAVDESGNITDDYGMLIICKNPINTSKTIIFAFGIWGQGTSIAIKSFISLSKLQLRRDISKFIKSGRIVCIVTKANIYGLEVGNFEIVDFKAH